MSLKIYTFYTDSHKKILDEYFLPSLYKTNKDLEVKIKKFDQKCISGDYMSDGWCETMMNKVDYILKSINETWGDVFIHADCDIQFFGPIKEDIIKQLADFDMVAQNDGEEMCCGFFACRSNNKTKTLFENVKKEINDKYNDQQATNKLAKNFVSYSFLDEKYYSIYRMTNKKVWDISMEIKNLPKNILVHHANWTVGIDNKIELMNIVKKVLENDNK